jgi:hypothetical protein
VASPTIIVFLDPRLDIALRGSSQRTRPSCRVARPPTRR